MKSIVSALLFTFSLSLTVLGQSGVRVSGSVSVATTGDVVHSATVKIDELKLTAVTGTDGSYSFPNVPPGQYTIVAHQEGFADSSKKVTVSSSSPASVDFQLQISGIQEEVTVSGSGTEVLAFESIANVATLNSTDIVSRAPVSLGDALQGESGVAKRSGGAGNGRPVIRGFDGDRVKVAADGIGIGSLGSQSGDHAEPLDILSVDRIEVVKGPATLLYGSNAIGGVVNAISGHDEGAHPGTRGYFSTLGGINGGQAAVNGGIEYGKDRWMFWSNAGTQRSGDYTAGGNFGKVQNTFTRNTTGSIGFGYFAKKAFFNTTYSYNTNKYGVPLDIFESDPTRRSLRVWRGDIKFNFGYNDPTLFITGIKFTADFSNYRHQELAETTVGTTFRNKVNSIRGMFEQKKFGRLSGRFGFEGFDRTFSTVGDETLVQGPVKQKAVSLFGLQELNFEGVTIQFGARLERNAYNPDNPALLDRAFTGASGALGAKFKLWDGGLFVANYSHGFRAPALDELYNNGPHDGSLLFERGNRLLRPEVSNGLDLSLRHHAARVKAEANFYYYSFKDFVFLAPTGLIDVDSGFEIADYLQRNSRFTGTELSLDVAVHKNLNLITGLDYVNAQLSTGQPLPRIAPLRARVGLDYHKGNFSARPEFVAVGRQDRVFTNETPTAGYGTVNLTASYVIPTKHTANVFSVNAFNLNNKLYYNHISFIKDISPEIGRGVKFSYTLRFF
jgi:iron complex outermembrane recepter protein